MAIRWQIETFDQVESTQITCFEAARSGVAEGCVVVAQSQSDGKGRHGRVWETGAGNLAFSCLLKPSCGAQNVGQLALVVGVALAEVFDEKTNATVRLKWPNDVFINGKKCAGILIESELTPANELDFAVVGVGINITEAPEYAHALNDFAEQGFSTESLLQEVLQNIDKHYALWEREGFEQTQENWNALSDQKIDESGLLIEGGKDHAVGY